MGLPNQRWQHDSSVHGKWVEGMRDERLNGVKSDQISDVL